MNLPATLPSHTYWNLKFLRRMQVVSLVAPLTLMSTGIITQAWIFTLAMIPPFIMLWWWIRMERRLLIDLHGRHQKIMSAFNLEAAQVLSCCSPAGSNDAP